MPPEPTPGTTYQPVSAAESKLRMQAFVRSWLCPGAGAALLGWPGVAFFTWLSIVVFLGTSALFVFRPSVASGVLAGLTLLVGLTMWTIEQVGVFLFVIRPPRLQWLFRFYGIWTVLMSLTFLVLLAILIDRHSDTILDWYGL